MNRQVQCGRGEARTRTEVAERYLLVAELMAGKQEPAAHNVAVGNAVLAGIAASDALCCLRLGRRSRSQDHRIAIDALMLIDAALARDLDRLLQMKDTAHYGDRFVTQEKLTSAVRAGRRLVETARGALRE